MSISPIIFSQAPKRQHPRQAPQTPNRCRRGSGAASSAGTARGSDVLSGGALGIGAGDGRGGGVFVHIYILHIYYTIYHSLSIYYTIYKYITGQYIFILYINHCMYTFIVGAYVHTLTFAYYIYITICIFQLQMHRWESF